MDEHCLHIGCYPYFVQSTWIVCTQVLFIIFIGMCGKCIILIFCCFLLMLNEILETGFFYPHLLSFFMQFPQEWWIEVSLYTFLQVCSLLFFYSWLCEFGSRWRANSWKSLPRFKPWSAYYNIVLRELCPSKLPV